MTRIYGIGLSKTGTRSLTEALSILTKRRCYHGPDVDTIAARGSATDAPSLGWDAAKNNPTGIPMGACRVAAS